jgi:hypothetical protein
LRAFSEYPKVSYDESTWPKKVRSAIRNLKPDASPGYPLGYQYSTNKAALEALGEEYFVAVVLARLKAIKEAPREAFESWTPGQLVDAFLCDPIRVFVKNEVHSQKKIDDKRMRLIMSVSVIDQLVERVLDANQNHAEIEGWANIHSKPGMGLHDTGLATLEEEFRSHVDPAGTDAEKFDMTVEQWKLDADATRRARLAGQEGYDTMFHRRARLLGFAVLVLSSGKVFDQVRRGIQKSGAFTTSSSNSAMRVTDCALITPVGYPMRVCAMGDDCVEDVGWLPEGADTYTYLRQAYRKVGLNIKEVERFTEKSFVEFCAYRFTLNGNYSPVRWDKMLATFLVNWPQPVDFEERLHGLYHELRHSPHLYVASEVIQSVAQEILERSVGSRNSQD